MPSCSNVRNWLGIRRSTMPMVPRLLEDGDAEADAVAELDGEVGPALLLQLLLAAVGRDGLHQAGGVVGVEDLAPMSSLRRRPWWRTTGGWPTVMCRSLALSWMTVASSLSIETLTPRESLVRWQRHDDRRAGERDGSVVILRVEGRWELGREVLPRCRIISTACVVPKQDSQNLRRSGGFTSNTSRPASYDDP